MDAVTVSQDCRGESSSLRLPLGGFLHPSTAQAGRQIHLADPLPALQRCILGCFGKGPVRHQCPASPGGNEQEVMNSVSREAAGLGGAKMSPILCARGCPKALKTTHCAMAGRESRHKHHRWMERFPLAPACSQHERCHSTLLELGPGYKGLATRVLIHNASVNTFIFLELHQGLETEKTVTPTQNLAQWPRL